MAFYTYILASGRNGTLYTGSTDDLVERVFEHKEKRFGGFTANYDVHHLVWYETHPTRELAFQRGRQIKKWNRVWKLELIEKDNPGWNDLHDALRLGDLRDARDWQPPSADEPKHGEGP